MPAKWCRSYPSDFCKLLWLCGAAAGRWQVAPEAIPCWNPAFDYAPAELITGIITEHGVLEASD